MHCDACGIAYVPEFDRNVEVTFDARPSGRGAAPAAYCLAGPQTARQTLAQTSLAPGAEASLLVALPAGAYVVQALPDRVARFTAEDDAGAGTLDVRVDEAGVRAATSVVQAGAVRVRVENASARDAVVRVSEAELSDQIATAAEVTALQAFRDLFAGEVPATATQFAIRSLTVVFTDVAGSTQMYADAGDAHAFGLVRRYFDAVQDVVALARGAVVKTMGDAVMAVFADPRDAVDAALRFAAAAAPLELRIGMHRGPCIAMCANERLDYAGATVNLAARVAHAAGAGEILMTSAVADDARVADGLPDGDRGTVVLRGLPASGRGDARPRAGGRDGAMSEANPLYDDPVLAAAYARVTAANVYNAAYERPGVREVLGEVRGRDVLDAGAAAGENSAWLVAHGARVVALDASDAMVELARARLGAAATVLRADLACPLPLADASFDAVLSSLTLHYLEDWLPPLREFARVLRPGGRLVLSTHHPALTDDPAADYHAVRLVEEGMEGARHARVGALLSPPAREDRRRRARGGLRAARAARAAAQRRSRRARSRRRGEAAHAAMVLDRRRGSAPAMSYGDKRYDEFRVGDTTTFSKTITEADILLFAAVSGDQYPLHVDAEYAKTTRFGQRAAHGMLTASLLSTVNGLMLQKPGGIYVEQSVRFRRPVFIGDTLTARAEVTELITDKRRLRVRTSIVNQHGKTVVDGEGVIQKDER